MPDHATSADPAVQRQLDRLAALSPGADTLGLERITTLLDRVGNPHRQLPPIFHVAGTNGKGSTCAYLRAAIEASGQSCHVYTSPHLVRFNERIRIAGRLIDDVLLAALLAEVLDIAGDVSPSFFEVTTTAAFLAFARNPADACVIEVGLGGRLDATNVIERPVMTGIAELGLDHQAFLGDTMEAIAAEKAGIAKAGVPLVTLRYPTRLAERIERIARDNGAQWLAQGKSWDAGVYQGKLHYRDDGDRIDLPLPRLVGAHQAINAALAVAMLRHQDAISVPPSALKAAMGWAEWPARLQHLTHGALPAIAPEGADLWLDGGHNPAAARVIADFFEGYVPLGRPLHLIVGLLSNKDAAGFLHAFAGRATMLHAVPVPGHESHTPESLVALARENGIGARDASDPAEALAWIARHAGASQPPVILIAGSLYLAGTVLAANGTPPE